MSNESKKKISFVIPCRNEEDNVIEIATAIRSTLQQCRPSYDCEIIFADNRSTDKTRIYLRRLCSKDANVKAIFNSVNSPFSTPNAMRHVSGDACIYMACDFQDPVELIPAFIEKWENGAQIVCGIKEGSEEKKSMRAIRDFFYKLMKKMASAEPYPVNYLNEFTGFGLYSRQMIDLFNEVFDPSVSLRGFVAEYGFNVVTIPFVQPKRKKGKSKLNLYSLYDFAMLNITSYSKILIRSSAWVGALLFLIGVIGAIVSLAIFSRISNEVLLFFELLLVGILLLYLGLLSEYILNLQKKLSRFGKPLLLEEELINFVDDKETK